MVVSTAEFVRRFLPYYDSSKAEFREFLGACLVESLFNEYGAFVPIRDFKTSTEHSIDFEGWSEEACISAYAMLKAEFSDIDFHVVAKMEPIEEKLPVMSTMPTTPKKEKMENKKVYSVSQVVSLVDKVEHAWDLSAGGSPAALAHAWNELEALVGKEVAREIVPSYVFHPYW